MTLFLAALEHQARRIAAWFTDSAAYKFGWCYEQADDLVEVAREGLREKLVQREAEEEVFEVPSTEEDPWGDVRDIRCPSCGPVSQYEKDLCSYIRCGKPKEPTTVPAEVSTRTKPAVPSAGQSPSSNPPPARQPSLDGEGGEADCPIPPGLASPHPNDGLREACALFGIPQFMLADLLRDIADDLDPRTTNPSN